MFSRRDMMGAAALLPMSFMGRNADAQPAPIAAEHLATFRSKLKGALHTPSDPTYDEARRGEGTTPVDGRRPALIVLPESDDDIARTVDFARGRDLDLSVRSGGHDILAASTTAHGVVIDLQKMAAVHLEPASGLVSVGAGARSGVLNAAGAPHGLAPVLGMSPHVGVGGVSLGGGIGWLCGRYGAAVDHLRSVDLVTADGRRIRASREESADLFWALRGGGGNFGVATSFTYQMQPIAPVLAGRVSYRVQPRPFLKHLQEILSSSPDELDVGVNITPGPEPVATVALCWSGDLDEGDRAVRSLRSYAPAINDNIRRQAFVDFVNTSPISRVQNLYWRGGAFAGLTEDVINAIERALDGAAAPGCAVGVLHYMHGRLCRSPLADTPFLRPEGQILFTVTALWGAGLSPPEKMAWVRERFSILDAASAKQTYVNYLSHDDEGAVRRAFAGHYQQLRDVKRRYDPDNVFHNNRNIRP